LPSEISARVRVRAEAGEVDLEPPDQAVRQQDGRRRILRGRGEDAQGDAEAMDLWCVGDQIRKGTALNAVQIAEML
jgi:aspartate-semialdehyde dehydrogenase